eukprot:6251842-Heterocapsa_arctica.AAC.1
MKIYSYVGYLAESDRQMQLRASSSCTMTRGIAAATRRTTSRRTILHVKRTLHHDASDASCDAANVMSYGLTGLRPD